MAQVEDSSGSSSIDYGDNDSDIGAAKIPRLMGTFRCSILAGVMVIVGLVVAIGSHVVTGKSWHDVKYYIFVGVGVMGLGIVIMFVNYMFCVVRRHRTRKHAKGMYRIPLRFDV